MATTTTPNSTTNPCLLSPQTLHIPPYTFTLRAATASDIPAMVDVFDAAFAQDMLFRVMRGSADPAALRERDIERWRTGWGVSGRRGFVVVDEGSGEVAAIARWWVPHTLTPEEEAAAEAAKKAPKPEPLPGSNGAAEAEFQRLLLENREKWVKKDDMYFMNILAVSPAYQRLGLGAALLAPVLKIADEEGRKTYIEASNAGVKLYRRSGWVETGDTIQLDFEKFGGEGRVDILLMMREPGAGVGV